MRLTSLIILLQVEIFMTTQCVQFNVSNELRTNFSAFDMTGKYKYVGCYGYDHSSTSLPHVVLIGNLSSARCYMHCMDRGNLFFGLSRDLCFCGNSYNPAEKKPESACDAACGLEPRDKCGGNWAMSVHVVIEKFTPMGCFLEWHQSDSDHKFMGSDFTKLGCALTCKRDARSPYFGLRDRHNCECISSIEWFVQREDHECISVCLEPGITGCGKNGLTSVYSMEYAESTSKVLDSYISFMSIDRQILLTINWATLPGLVVPPKARLFVQVYSEDAPGSGNFTELIGETRSTEATPCPKDWLSYSMQSPTHRQGYRCYLLVRRPAMNWTEALQHCWRRDSDLFYKEENSELHFLANSSSAGGELWVGLHQQAESSPFVWTEDTTGLNGSARRRVPRLLDNGCVWLDAGSGMITVHSCSTARGFICKRLGSLHSSWNQQLTTSVKANRRVNLLLMQSAGESVDARPLLQFNVSLQPGNQSVPIPSCPDCSLSYSTIERVPMRLCHPGPADADAPAFYRCQQPGNAPALTQFGKSACPTESFVRRGIGAWLQPLADWRDEVWYFVTEVRVSNRLNRTIRVESDRGVACHLVDADPPAWQKFSCNLSMKGLKVLASDQKYPYMHMCDLQVFGRLVSDNSLPRSANQFNETDRILDLKLQGIFEINSDASFPTLEQTIADELLLKIYADGELVTIVHPRHSDYFSIPLKYPQSFDKLFMFTTMRSRSTGNSRPLHSCTARLRMGNNRCRFLDRKYLLFSVKERINLHSCSQSSELLPVDYCANALDFQHGDTHQFGRCAQTAVSQRPWWKARVHSSFVFDQVTLYSRQGSQEWTRHFSVAIELTECVRVVNGTVFDKKTFGCHLAGTEIVVTALAKRVSLSLCEVVAYGQPGGCGEMRPKIRGDRCNGRLLSHVAYGLKPYERGLRCQWVVGGSSVHSVLLTFPEFRTANSGDFVEVYEGRGTSGRLLKRFYGNGEHRPKRPWMTAHGLINYVKARTSHMTIVFVTDRNASATEARTLETHTGFTAEMHLVMLTNPSYLRSSEGIVCSSELYSSYQESFCQFRNGLHPVYELGVTDGLKLIRAIERQLRLQQNRSLTDRDESRWSQLLSAPSDDGTLLRRKRSRVSEALLRQHYCYSPESIRRLPAWRRSCCCGDCSRLHFVMQCRHPYESVPAWSCDLSSERLPLRVAD